jgi:hypothetical protein
MFQSSLAANAAVMAKVDREAVGGLVDAARFAASVRTNL